MCIRYCSQILVGKTCLIYKELNIRSLLKVFFKTDTVIWKDSGVFLGSFGTEEVFQC